jgi:hypothetical protein
MLQLWNTVSTNIGSDISWGIGARIAQVGRAGRREGLSQDSGWVIPCSHALARGRSSHLLPSFFPFPQAMGITSFMLEDPDSLLLDIPAHADQEAAYAALDARRLKETEVFRMADDGVRGVSHPSLPPSLPKDPPSHSFFRCSPLDMTAVTTPLSLPPSLPPSGVHGREGERPHLACHQQCLRPDAPVSSTNDE